MNMKKTITLALISGLVAGNLAMANNHETPTEHGAAKAGCAGKTGCSGVKGKKGKKNKAGCNANTHKSAEAPKADPTPTDASH